MNTDVDGTEKIADDQKIIFRGIGQVLQGE